MQSTKVLALLTGVFWCANLSATDVVDGNTPQPTQPDNIWIKLIDQVNGSPVAIKTATIFRGGSSSGQELFSNSEGDLQIMPPCKSGDFIKVMPSSYLYEQDSWHRCPLVKNPIPVAKKELNFAMAAVGIRLEQEDRAAEASQVFTELAAALRTSNPQASRVFEQKAYQAAGNHFNVEGLAHGTRTTWMSQKLRDELQHYQEVKGLSVTDGNLTGLTASTMSGVTPYQIWNSANENIEAQPNFQEQLPDDIFHILSDSNTPPPMNMK
ncbi:hypothetical protein PAHA111176_11180 [Parendozoicomonas haliclonae]|uniref:Uncharacterized protein n=2 Tax=Parendozoicomonas haliclonae TaxID=1960125 RepID=A0A1X7ALI9_9GAMM|nr:hypothetical protein EHSB41UT_02711 [Parendozoicomonas haliclonae]